MKKKGIRILMILFTLLVLILLSVLFWQTITRKENLNSEWGEERREMKEELIFKEGTGEWYFRNDLGITDIGDPFVLKVSKDCYYMYCTSAPNGFYCWKSEDLVNWTDAKMCYVQYEDAWSVDCFWAPEVVAYEGKYYMYYTARNQENSLRIGLAVSDAPDGPFLDVVNEPLFDFGYAVIDANVFIDEDGAKYLYYSRDCSENIVHGIRKSEIYGIRLSEDMLSVTGEAVKLLTPEQRWEIASGDTWWNEGPEMIKHEGIYYLSYSANFFASPAYSLGYATSAYPLGPFVKAEENPILTSGTKKDVSGTGHHSFAWSPDDTELWAVYHSHTDLVKPDGNRKVNIDRAGFTEEGKLYINGPLTTMQPMPSGAATVNVTGQFKAQAAGMDLPLLTDGFYSIYRKHNNLDAAIPVEGNLARVILKADEETKICGVAIYPGQSGWERVKSIRLVLNDEVSSQEYQIKEEEAVPLILSFDSVSVSVLDILYITEEGTETIKLSEIMILMEKK